MQFIKLKWTYYYLIIKHNTKLQKLWFRFLWEDSLTQFFATFAFSNAQTLFEVRQIKFGYLSQTSMYSQDLTKEL